MHFQTDPVAKAVTEERPESSPLNVVPRQRVGIPAGHARSDTGRAALVDSYVGYYKPYATSHDELDTEKDFHEEVRNAARALVNAVRQSRRGEFKQPDRSLKEPRPK